MGKSSQSAQRSPLAKVTLEELNYFTNFPQITTKGAAQLRPGPKTRPILYPDNSVSSSGSAEARNTAHGVGRELGAAAADASGGFTRWFQYTLKEPKAGDIAMQVLVGQMYYSGYGVPRDDQKEWLVKSIGQKYICSRKEYLFRNVCNSILDIGIIKDSTLRRTSVWKVGNKHPGYNARDSDSDDTKEDVK